MKLICMFVTSYLYFLQTIDSRMVRLQIEDEIQPYSIDSSVAPIQTYFNFENFMLEQIDDDKVEIGGSISFIKSMDIGIPLQLVMRSQYLDRSVWTEGPLRFMLPSMCPEFLNPAQYWYNITKLFKPCPPKIGDIWLVERHIVSLKTDLPSNIATVPWKCYIRFSQFGGAVNTGFMIKANIVEIFN